MGNNRQEFGIDLTYKRELDKMLFATYLAIVTDRSSDEVAEKIIRKNFDSAKEKFIYSWARGWVDGKVRIKILRKNYPHFNKQWDILEKTVKKLGLNKLP